MKLNQLISIGKILAAAILILGIVHDVATFTPLIQKGLSCLSHSDLMAMTYMSLICGSALVLCGVLLLLLLKKPKHLPDLINYALIISVFLALNGVLSVVYMCDNPFAWIAFFLNMAMFVVVFGIKVKIKVPSGGD